MHKIFRDAPVLLLIAALAGCSQTEVLKRSERPHSPPASSITVNQLAKRLDLVIVRTASNHVLLEKDGNKVFIFTDPDGRAYVNGTQTGARGGVTRVKGVMFVPRAMEVAIRSALRKPAPKRPPPAAEPANPNRYAVAIDAGHGGKDPGATSCLGFYEKSVNLAVALELGRLLRRQGLNVRLVRDRDIFVELDARAEKATAFGADLFVSIHADSCPTPSVRGYTVYVCRSASSGSIAAARSIEKAMAYSGLQNKGIRKADFRVLVKTRCPAVLVELGYLSNAREAALLANEKFLEGMAQVLAKGILNYFRAGSFSL